tara:strand:+ start:32 stop:295 length:264 start_codon:yes stop_codon:yes gene_type:complete
MCYINVYVGVIMSEKKEYELTPFEKAKWNVQKTAENFNLYSSVEMLAMALNGIEKLSQEEQDTLNKMLTNVLESMAAFLEEGGEEWN